MTSSAANTTLYELRHLDELSTGTRAYFHARLKNRLYDLVISKFQEKEITDKLTKAKLARRTGHSPAVITRLLGSPGNWRLETVSDLLIGIAGEELDATSSSPLEAPARNYSADDDFVTIRPHRPSVGQSGSPQVLKFPEKSIA